MKTFYCKGCQVRLDGDIDPPCHPGAGTMWADGPHTVDSWAFSSRADIPPPAVTGGVGIPVDPPVTREEFEAKLDQEEQARAGYQLSKKLEDK